MWNRKASHNFAIQTNDRDILCGRGKANLSHPGNVMFSNMIKSHLQRYADATTRIERGALTVELRSMLSESGTRFFKKCKTTKQWIQINEHSSHEKIGHALRDTLRWERKKQNKKSAKGNNSKSKKSPITVATRKEHRRIITPTNIPSDNGFVFESLSPVDRFDSFHSVAEEISVATNDLLNDAFLSDAEETDKITPLDFDDIDDSTLTQHIISDEENTITTAVSALESSLNPVVPSVVSFCNNCNNTNPDFLLPDCLTPDELCHDLSKEESFKDFQF